LLIILHQLLAVLVRLAHGKLCRVLYGNEKIGNVPDEGVYTLMDGLGKAFMQVFKPTDENDGKLFNFSGTYRRAWTDYVQSAQKLFMAYYKNDQPWAASDMKKRFDKEMSWRGGYTDEGSPLAHNVPFLCSSLVEAFSVTMGSYPLSIDEVSTTITLPSRILFLLAHVIA
jgi:hypothetical protein